MQWFFKQAFGPNIGNKCADSTCITYNSDGSVTMNPNVDTEFYSAWVNSFTNQSARGKAFAGGGYFEATLSFPPSACRYNQNGPWPSFWLESLEAIALDSIGDAFFTNAGVKNDVFSLAWAGQPQYGTFGDNVLYHYAEIDMMETFSPGGTITSTVHDWLKKNNNDYSQIPGTNLGGNLQNQSYYSTTVDLNLPHKYGALWIPAAPGGFSTITYFFDDVATNVQSYKAFDCQNPPAPANMFPEYTYGIMDCNHFRINIAMSTVHDVHVWQATDANNLFFP